MTMTTHTTDTRQGAPFLLWPLLLLIVATGPLLATLSTPEGGVLTRSHAVEKHGTDAQEIRCNMRDEGPLEVLFKDADPCEEVWLTQLKCGRFGIMIVRALWGDNGGCEYVEKTSFVPKSGRYQDVIRYISRFATR